MWSEILDIFTAIFEKFNCQNQSLAKPEFGSGYHQYFFKIQNFLALEAILHQIKHFPDILRYRFFAKIQYAAPHCLFLKRF